MICYDYDGVHYIQNYCVYNKITIADTNCHKYIYTYKGEYYYSYKMQLYILIPIVGISHVHICSIIICIG